MSSVGIDIGGTTITIGIVENNKIIKSETIDNKYIGEPERLVVALSELIFQMEDKGKVTFIGAACPGRVSNSIVNGAVNLGYDNFPLGRMLKEKTGIDSLVENDATAALIGEIICGSLQGCENGIFLTIGTGVGGGICINGKPYRGSTSSAGEFGHYVFVRDGYPCKCGRKGCFEQYSSTTALIREVKKNIIKTNSLLLDYCKDDINQINGRLFFKAITENDTYCLSVLESFTENIAEGICDLINILDAEVVAIGGGISEAGDLFIKPVAKKVKAKGFNTNVIKASLGNSAGVIGASLLNRL